MQLGFDAGYVLGLCCGLMGAPTGDIFSWRSAGAAYGVAGGLVFLGVLFGYFHLHQIALVLGVLVLTICTPPMQLLLRLLFGLLGWVSNRSVQMHTAISSIEPEWPEEEHAAGLISGTMLGRLHSHLYRAWFMLTCVLVQVQGKCLGGSLVD